MELKQRISALAAATLPLVALAAFLVSSPTKASAKILDCSGNYDPSPNGDGGCGYQDIPAGGYSYFPQACPGPAWGTCDADGSGCVTCDSGDW